MLELKVEGRKDLYTEKNRLVAMIAYLGANQITIGMQQPEDQRLPEIDILCERNSVFSIAFDHDMA